MAWDSIPAGPMRQRARSWPPPSWLNGASDPSDIQDHESEVLFDACRFPRPTGDLLDWVTGEEAWQSAETADGRRVRVVGEAGALKRLFELPLQAAGEALCLHRIGDCLVVLDSAHLDDDREEQEQVGFGHAGGNGGSSPRYSPRGSLPRCQILVDGDMVRVFPSIETAEPVGVDAPPATTSPAVACCEWRVKDGISLLAVTPHSISSGDCGLADLNWNSQLRLLASPAAVQGLVDFHSDTGVLVVPQDVAKHRPSLPAYHRRVTEDRTAILVVPLSAPIETQTLVDSWLSCCLHGSPSLLCFFVDSKGVCRGCEFVLAADIPSLPKIAEAYRNRGRGSLTSGDSCSAAQTRDGATHAKEAVPDQRLPGESVPFEPRALRESSHALLESLIDRCDKDGGHFLLVPGPFGPRLLVPGSQDSSPDEDAAADDDNLLPFRKPLALKLPPAPLQLFPDADTSQVEVTEAQTGDKEQEEEAFGMSDRLRRSYVTQALLMYHAAVRLSQPLQGAATKRGDGIELKDVPSGSRWTAKSCRNPLRVRKMLLRAVRALRCASYGQPRSPKGPLSHQRYHLLLASASEFLADTFLAEETYGDDHLDLSRYLTALHHLQRSSRHIAEYAGSLTASSSENSNFVRSLKQLEQRVSAKAVNARLCMARLRQKLPWRQCSDAGFGCLGQALKELDAAEALVTLAPRLGPQRSIGAYESSLLASNSKWKADLLHELAGLALPFAAPGAELDVSVIEYLEAQQRETDDAVQPLPMQCERWLQSTVSLSLRGIHQLASVPSEIGTELQMQAKALLAQAYGKLGRLYASTGRFTKAMTHAKQGIELFNATQDRLQAAKLQLWLCRLQLRMAVPQAAPSGQSACAGILEDPALLSGLSAAGAAEDTACAQVVQLLQKALSALEGQEGESFSVFTEGQVLLGRVLLRQGLVCLARAPTPSLRAACRLMEDAAFVGTLELLQEKSSSEVAMGSDTGGPAEVSKSAAERLLQAASTFRAAGARDLCGIAHACLAAVYFCNRSEARASKLALTHCQHAREELVESRHSLEITVKLIEAKVSRHATTKGCPAWVGDARSAMALCEAALARRRSSSAATVEEVAVDAEDAGSLQLTAYLRQELSDALLHLLKSYDRQDDLARELKPLYCALLTAWHAEAGLTEALGAVAAHARKLLERAP